MEESLIFVVALPSLVIAWGRPTLAEIMSSVLQQWIGLARGLEPCGFVALQKCFCIGMCLCLPLFVFNKKKNLKKKFLLGRFSLESQRRLLRVLWLFCDDKPKL